MSVWDADYRTVEANLAANLRQIREDQRLSQDELATRMTERGFGFSQATIWKIEQGKRPVKISEAVALADAVGFASWTNLLSSPGSASHQLRLQTANRKAYNAYHELKAAAERYLRAQIELSLVANLARGSGQVDEVMIERMTDWVTTPGEQAVLEARIGEGRDEELLFEISEEAAQIMEVLRERGYQPFVDIDSWRSSADDDPIETTEGTDAATDLG